MRPKAIPKAIAIPMEKAKAQGPTPRGKVRCIDCALFDQGHGSQDALGSCLGRPWDKFSGQWPFPLHYCLDFIGLPQGIERAERGK